MNDKQRNYLGTFLFLYIGADYLASAKDTLVNVSEKTVSGKHLKRFTINEKHNRKAYKKAWDDYNNELRKELSKIDRLEKLLLEVSNIFDKSHQQFQDDYEALTDLFDKLHPRKD